MAEWHGVYSASPHARKGLKSDCHSILKCFALIHEATALVLVLSIHYFNQILSNGELSVAAFRSDIHLRILHEAQKTSGLLLKDAHSNSTIPWHFLHLSQSS